jgi:hypothetical protein
MWAAACWLAALAAPRPGRAYAVAPREYLHVLALLLGIALRLRIQQVRALTARARCPRPDPGT